jgi:lysophospholipase L1-like esterase
VWENSPSLRALLPLPSALRMNSKTLLALTVFPVLAFAQEAPKPAAPPAPVYEPKPIVDTMDLKDGDTLVFLGDSITHQCLYTQYIEDYFYTRFPKARIRFHNAGVGGDRAADALRRFDEDVAAYKPKYVTILLGMNDGSYTKYEQNIFDTYMRDMNTVLDRIAELGAVAVPMTPTMHDARARRLYGKPAEPRETFYNGVLALYGAWLQEQAEVRGLGFVDMYSPLNSLSLEQRTKDPKWTMIRDAVHPGATGQTVMACAILNDMVKKSPVSQVIVAERNGKLSARARNGTVADFNAADGKVSFTLTANALPWVLPPEAAEGFLLTHAARRFSVEKLTVHHLKPGKYDVKIDDQSIGSWTAEQLEVGVELAANDKTPQYQQALQVALLNKRRNGEAYHPIRDQYGALKGKRRELQKAIDANDPALEQKKTEFETWYATMKSKIAELLAKAKTIEDEIYQANQPKPRRYEIALTTR